MFSGSEWVLIIDNYFVVVISCSLRFEKLKKIIRKKLPTSRDMNANTEYTEQVKLRLLMENKSQYHQAVKTVCPEGRASITHEVFGLKCFVPSLI